ncbi:MAG: methylated-DNA--[protein]-cysteine S-methyltransferase [Acidobacteriia bacterium]|nr:methylated-DNA--[protein]-cysteine S-methyltransferase [Terriglobia bacterium]
MKSLLAKHYTTFDTSAGTCAIAWNDIGISRFQLPTERPEEVETWQQRRVPGAVPGSPNSDVSRVIEAAIRYFDGHLVDFSDAAVDLRGQPEFFAKTYISLRDVPYGKTTTYGELAKSVGEGVERSREVGIAMATNPVPLIIPCHRVLAAGGRLGGFSAPGGTESKTRMLRLEGIAIVPRSRLNFTQTAQSSFAF